MAARLNDMGVRPRKFHGGFAADTGPAAGLLADLTSRSARGDSLIFVWHHHGDGGLRVVNVERAASGNQFDEAGTLIVVADIQGNGDSVATWAAAKDSETEHPDNIPKASGFVLTGHAFGHGYVSIKNRAREENGEFDSSFLRGLGDFDLHAVGDGLRSRVTVNDFAKRRLCLVRVHGD